MNLSAAKTGTTWLYLNAITKVVQSGGFGAQTARANIKHPRRRTAVRLRGRALGQPMTDGKIVSASLPPELVDALEETVQDNPELSQAQVVREGLRMRLQMEE